ncbi:MAG: protein DA1 [Ignavibacteriales bacterium]|nr:protein DA1 [Ignavibacteriales bacterium]
MMLTRNVIVVLLLAYLIAGTGATFSQQKKKCAGCGKQIKSKSLSIDGYTYHPEHFLCAECKKPIQGTFTKFNSIYFHQECAAQKAGLLCAYCKKSLEDQFITWEQKLYHSDCFKNFVVPKCVICGKPIEGEYLVNTYDEKFHTFHAEECKSCDNCGRLVCDASVFAGQLFSDGRAACKTCYKLAVFKNEEIQALKDEVMDSLSAMGMNLRREAVSLVVVNLDQLRLVSNNILPPSGLRGFCYSETKSSSILGYQISSSTEHTIYTLNGLPAVTIQAIIAHELTHAWLRENSKRNFSTLMLEGSCNFVAYRYLLAKSSPDVKELITRIEKDAHPIYGEGFRSVKAAFENASLPDFLEYLKLSE